MHDALKEFIKEQSACINNYNISNLLYGIYKYRRELHKDSLTRTHDIEFLIKWFERYGKKEFDVDFL